MYVAPVVPVSIFAESEERVTSEFARTTRLAVPVPTAVNVTVPASWRPVIWPLNWPTANCIDPALPETGSCMVNGLPLFEKDWYWSCAVGYVMLAWEPLIGVPPLSTYIATVTVAPFV